MIGVKGEDGKFSIDQVGIERERESLINMIAFAPKASIIHVHAYESKTGNGEVSNSLNGLQFVVCGLCVSVDKK